MPIDLFVGKSSVQTYIYVFRVHEAHKADDIVKFIDFSNDGYTRTNRKKASCNLRDTDHAKERYEELVNVVRFGKEKLHYIEAGNYFEGHIDPNSGADWNQSAPVDTTPTQSATKTYKIGDVVNFTGTKHYTSSSALSTAVSLSLKAFSSSNCWFKLSNSSILLPPNYQ